MRGMKSHHDGSLRIVLDLDKVDLIRRSNGETPTVNLADKIRAIL